jgi:hypothetical protein
VLLVYAQWSNKKMSLWQSYCQRQLAAGKPTILAALSLPGMFFRQIKAKPLVNQVMKK